MKGDTQILELLNAVLTAELTAINQYFIHHKMCENWGYERLSQKKREESIGEMKDADAVIERILYLEGVPNMQRLNPVRVGEDAIEQHKLDLALERDAIERLNQGIAAVRGEGRQRHPRAAREDPRRRGSGRRLAGEPAAHRRRDRQGALSRRADPRVAPAGARFRKPRCAAPSCGGARRTRAPRSGT